MGRQPGSQPEKNLGQNVVVQLATPLYGSGRNVSIDNYFISLVLLWQKYASTQVDDCWDDEEMQKRDS